MLPLFPRKVTRFKKCMRRYKHALWLVGIFVNAIVTKRRYIAASVRAF